MTQPLVVTAYTPGYADLVQRLIASCDRFGMDVCALPYPDRGSWEANTHVKTDALSYALEAPGLRHLLWVDADAEFVAPWTWELPASADVAVHVLRRAPGRNPETLSGTVYVRRSAVLPVLAAWRRASRPDKWDQRCLESALPSLRWCELPPECCWIHDTHPGLFPDVSPVVVHYQASREVRKGKRKA